MTIPPFERGMVVVGAGECGLRAAIGLRERGSTAPVTLIGAELHLPYERPPLSKDAMAIDGGPEPKAVASRDMLEEQGVSLIAGAEVVAIDRSAKAVRLSTGGLIPYDKLLLATGARPRRLPMAEGLSACVYLRTFDDARAIRAHLTRGVRVAVIGGGFIGLELAASARRLGCPVTVVESLPRLLMRAVPADIAEVIEREHRDRGVDILTGMTIEAIEETETGLRIALAGGRTVEADLCIVGIGAVPNVELAEGAGLATSNGIAVDAELRTSDPDIFAAGDCCSFPLDLYGGRRLRLEAWRNAQEQGALAAANMLGGHEGHDAVPWFWSDQYDLGLQIAGLCDEGRHVVRRDLGEGSFILFHLAEDGRLVAASGIGPGTAVARDIRLAEMLIARRSRPVPQDLAAPHVKLKALLAA
ncbi:MULTISPECIES: NAD(P)/FAD-dependent oxidoreductase [unclassified Aureimonas]|uniref:NAD(P)/FAD-dependent oxidoreductase n=1 Tax=unclassified Aureimonas TaxID=2615206 RepID=UPI0006F8BCB0|nr:MULTISPECIES: FAD-dependent oxidoreductase [unclassified Aureimonas]KQT53840.1 ferredoxin reductase [Aureimonas sp. Leaf427]KQT71719.1 ferredoxin reductase [Aureimonas sp. Leaf460]